MTRFTIGLLAIAAFTAMSSQTVYATDGFKQLIQTQQGKAQLSEEEPAPPPATKRMKPSKLPKAHIVIKDTVSELSAQDCKNVGGSVITVTDDRCGSTRKYCRMPDTNAVCIDVAN
jgi:putative hemolysin